MRRLFGYINTRHQKCMMRKCDIPQCLADFLVNSA